MGLPELSSWLPLFLLVSLLLFIKIKKYAQNKKVHLPPSPPKLPIIGNLHNLGPLPHHSMFHLSNKYGPVMLLQLGSIPTIIISSAEAAKEVLKTHDLDCCSRPPLAGTRKLSYNYLDMAFSPYGDYWRQIRKICVLELFSLKRVKSYSFIREEEVDLLVESLSQSVSLPVNLTEKLFGLTASVIWRIAFGKKFRESGFNHVRFHEVVHEAETMLGSFQSSEYFPYVGWIIDRINGRHQRLERISKELDKFFEQVVDEHLDPERKKPEQDDIIDVLLGIVREQVKFGDSWLGKNNIKAVLLNIFLAGVDTAAVTLVWAMTELVRKPMLLKKAQEEVRNLLGNKGRVNENDTENLHYLKMIIKETLRLHPPAPLLVPRHTMSHFKLHNYDILPKTIIQVNTWAIGRDPKYWTNPDEFIPERFADNSIDYKGQHFEFLPFGGGRRICPGMSMATTTVELVLANLLYCFDWKLPDGMKIEDINMEDTAGLSLTVDKKVPLSLVPLIPSPS